MRDSSAAVDVLVATLRFFPDYSGPGERFRRYASGLKARGVRLRVFSVAWIEDESDSKTVKEDFKSGQMMSPVWIDGIRVDRVLLSRRMGRARMMWAYFKGLRRFATLERRPDVIQLLTISPWAIPSLVRLRGVGIPIIYTHTMVRDPSVGRLKNFVHTLAFRFLDLTIVSTTVMRDSLRELGVKCPIRIIPNGVDLERFSPVSSESEKRQIRKALGLPETAEMVCFVGGFLEPRKGVDVLADAWIEVSVERPHAWLILVGPHHNDLRPRGPQKEYLRRVSDSLERSVGYDRVKFTGRVDSVEDYLRVSDVFVFPSRREGMPNVVPEAYSCGIASILTEFVGFPKEFGRAGHEFVLVDRDPSSLSDAIIDLLGDRAKRAEFQRNARRWTESHLGLPSSLDQYADVYTEFAVRPVFQGRSAS